jgi:hypothetical protein
LILATVLLTHVANSTRMSHADNAHHGTFVLSARLASDYTMTNIKFRRAHRQWSDVCFPGRAKQGETYTSSGIYGDGKSLAERFAATLRFAIHAPRKPGVAFPATRRTHAFDPGKDYSALCASPPRSLGATLRVFVAVVRRRHSGPENKRDPH